MQLLYGNGRGFVRPLFGIAKCCKAAKGSLSPGLLALCVLLSVICISSLLYASVLPTLTHIFVQLQLGSILQVCACPLRHARMCRPQRLCPHLYVLVNVYLNTHTRTHTCIHTYIHTHKHTHTHTNVRIAGLCPHLCARVHPILLCGRAGQHRPHVSIQPGVLYEPVCKVRVCMCMCMCVCCAPWFE